MHPQDEHDPNPTVHRLAAFTDRQGGGNPAGVVVTDAALPEAVMQAVAREVGYSETAFLVPRAMDGPGDAGPRSADRRPSSAWDVRYFAPAMEVPFCGHATIASGVHLAATAGPGRHLLHTVAGVVAVDVGVREDGLGVAALTSVVPRHAPAPPGLLRDALTAFGWDETMLDATFAPVAIADAGARHLVLVVTDLATLQAMAYDHDLLLTAMTAHRLVTVLVAHHAGGGVWKVRNPFPTGGVVEDPATGAAAAALGGLLRDRGHLVAPADLVLHQGVEVGRPSRLDVHVPVSGGIVVRGTAVPIDDARSPGVVGGGRR